MNFKAKLFKLGNSKGIYIPKEVYTNLEEGKEYKWEVYTHSPLPLERSPKVYTPPEKVIMGKSNKMEMCSKHLGSMKITCGCK